VRYAAKNPFSYVHANIGGQVALFETIKVRPCRAPCTLDTCSHPECLSYSIPRPHQESYCLTEVAMASIGMGLTKEAM